MQAMNELTGEYVLQVEEALDIASPQRDRFSGNYSAKRMLHLELYDGERRMLLAIPTWSPELNFSPCPAHALSNTGYRRVVAIEHSPLALDTYIKRGAKVVLRGPVEIRRGVLFLTSDNIALLGGCVQQLEDEQLFLKDFFTREPGSRRGPQRSIEDYLLEAQRALVDRNAQLGAASGARQHGGGQGPNPGPGTSSNPGRSGADRPNPPASPAPNGSGGGRADEHLPHAPLRPLQNRQHGQMQDTHPHRELNNHHANGTQGQQQLQPSHHHHHQQLLQEQGQQQASAGSPSFQFAGGDSAHPTPRFGFQAQEEASVDIDDGSEGEGTQEPEGAAPGNDHLPRVMGSQDQEPRDRSHHQPASAHLHTSHSRIAQFMPRLASPRVAVGAAGQAPPPALGLMSAGAGDAAADLVEGDVMDDDGEEWQDQDYSPRANGDRADTAVAAYGGSGAPEAFGMHAPEGAAPSRKVVSVRPNAQRLPNDVYGVGGEQGGSDPIHSPSDDSEGYTSPARRAPVAISYRSSSSGKSKKRQRQDGVDGRGVSPGRGREHSPRVLGGGSPVPCRCPDTSRTAIGAVGNTHQCLHSRTPVPENDGANDPRRETPSEVIDLATSPGPCRPRSAPSTERQQGAGPSRSPPAQKNLSPAFDGAGGLPAAPALAMPPQGNVSDLLQPPAALADIRAGASLAYRGSSIQAAVPQQHRIANSDRNMELSLGPHQPNCAGGATLHTGPTSAPRAASTSPAYSSDGGNFDVLPGESDHAEAAPDAHASGSLDQPPMHLFYFHQHLATAPPTEYPLHALVMGYIRTLDKFYEPQPGAHVASTNRAYVIMQRDACIIPLSCNSRC